LDPISLSGLILACLLFSALFSGSETALLRMREPDIEGDIREGRSPSAVAVRDLLSSTSRLLVTLLLGNNLANILGAGAASALAMHYLGEGRGLFVSTVLMTVVVLIFCEVLPKAVAAAHPKRIAYAVALPIYLAHQLLRPVHALFDRLVEPVVGWVAGGAETAPHSSEEVLRLARQIRTGPPDGSALAIMGAAAGAEAMTAGEIMVPRTEILAFPVDMELSEMLERMLEERYTRAPIYEGDIDHIIGVIHFKDLVKAHREGRRDVHGILKPVLRIPERKPILELLADMQRAFVHVAVVKDEFGVTLGLVTQEDILEEIVGEIRDEFDREELQAIRRLENGSYLALGRIKVLDFNRATGWDLEAAPGDTLSGLIFNTLGRSPRKGDVVRVGRYELAVVDLSGTRITRVRVDRLPPEEAQRNDDGGPAGG